MKRISIALVGDFNEKIPTLVALNESIEHARPHLQFALDVEWVGTDHATKVLSARKAFDGIWVVPGSPYKNDDGVYAIIKNARESNTPILGTCGGFQYMILEYAKNVLQVFDASHEEVSPDGVHVISKLSCSLKGQEEYISIEKNSWLHAIFNSEKILGRYFCSYGINPLYIKILDEPPLIFVAFSPTGEVRAFEINGHRYFKGTLF